MRWVMSAALILVLATTVYAMTKRAAVIRRVVKSTVVIRTDKHTSASGTVIGAYDGYSFILTCNHVVNDATQFFVHPTESSTDISPATVLKTDANNDLALLLATSYMGVKPLPIAAKDPELYDTIYLIGNAYNKPGSASEGILSDKLAHDDALPNAVLWRVTGGFVFYGISGGTAVNAEGQLVCVPNMIEIAHVADEAIPLPQMGMCIPRAKVIEFTKGYVHQ